MSSFCLIYIFIFAYKLEALLLPSQLCELHCLQEKVKDWLTSLSATVSIHSGASEVFNETHFLQSLLTPYSEKIKMLISDAQGLKKN